MENYWSFLLTDLVAMVVLIFSTQFMKMIIGLGR